MIAPTVRGQRIRDTCSTGFDIISTRGCRIHTKGNVGEPNSTRVLCRVAGINRTTSTQMANEGGISDTGSNNHGPPEVSVTERATDKPTTQEGTRRECSNNGNKQDEQRVAQFSGNGSTRRISYYIGEWIQIHIYYV